MTVVSDRNFEDVVTGSMRDEYWRRVARSLSDIFKSNPDTAADYRRLVDGQVGLSRILPYHDDPLQIAADLAGEDLTSEHVELYEKMFPDPIPFDQPVSTLP